MERVDSVTTLTFVNGYIILIGNIKKYHCGRYNYVVDMKQSCIFGGDAREEKDVKSAYQLDASQNVVECRFWHHVCVEQLKEVSFDNYFCNDIWVNSDEETILIRIFLLHLIVCPMLTHVY